MLHDLNGDGRICPNDVYELASKVTQTTTLLSNDIYQLMYNLKRKLVIEVKPPGHILKTLDEELARKWNEKQRANFDDSFGSRGSSHDSSKSKQSKHKQIKVTNVDGANTFPTKADGSESERSQASSHRHKPGAQAIPRVDFLSGIEHMQKATKANLPAHSLRQRTTKVTNRGDFENKKRARDFSTATNEKNREAFARQKDSKTHDLHEKHFGELLKASSQNKIDQVFDLDMEKLPPAPMTNFLEFYAFQYEILQHKHQEEFNYRKILRR